MRKLNSADSATLTLYEIDATLRRQPLTPQGYADILQHRAEYIQVAQDNQNLIWLYTLMLEDEIVLPRGEIISAMKQRLLAENSLTPLAWQYVANGTADDFRVVLDSQDPGEEPQWRWRTLVAWLQVLSGLRLHSPIPEPIQELFLHDGLVVDSKNGEVNFRGAWMKFDTLRRILDEAKIDWRQTHWSSLQKPSWSR